MTDLKSISIIIPTKDRPNKLKNLLRSIIDSGDSYYELLIIDSSINKNNLTMNQLNTIRIGGKHILFNKKGLSKARNKGINESKGDIVIFADDDFIVRKGWINNMVLNFSDPQVACVTGRMMPYRDDDTSNLYEKAMSFDRGHKKRIFSKNNLRILNLFLAITKIGQKRLHDKTPVPWAVGYGFCAFRRQVFQNVGFFDENLGRGTKAVGGDDIDMFYRILKSGLNIVYEPKATILHDHRKNLGQIFIDARQAGISMRSFISKYYAKDNYLRCIFFGYFFLSFFSSLNATLKSDDSLRKMIKTELIGFLQNTF